MPAGRLAALIERLRLGWHLAAYGNRHFLRQYGPGHYYSPLPDIDEVRRTHAAVADRSRRHVPGIDLHAAAQRDLVRAFAAYQNDLPFPRQARDGCRYHLDNPFFAFGDGVVLWSMLAHFRPQRVVEIGSGYSSAAMLDAADALQLATSFTFVDPYPQRLLSLLGAADRQRCNVVERAVQTVDTGIFDNLTAGDLLFIDSSHVAKFGSDLNYLLAEVMPALCPGVLVHVHDVCWPFEYPLHWFEDGRAWNEAYMMRAFLQFNDAFEILLFNDYLAAQHADLLAECLPLMLERPASPLTLGNSSLWLRRCG